MRRTERIEILKDVARRLSERDWMEIDLILRQFEQPVEYEWHGSEYSYCLNMMDNIQDELLLELYDYLGGNSPDVVHERGGPWKPGWFRLFLSHLSAEKIFVGQIKLVLAKYGIDGFVAHADIEPSREWQTTIELALGTCDALAALLHEGFRESNWTDQEVGYALARRVKIIPLIFDVMPYGFMARWQGARCRGMNPERIARLLVEALKEDDRTREKLWDGVVMALGESESFNAANERGYFLDDIDTWPSERLDRLEAALKNSQVEGAWHAKPRVERILKDHGRLGPADDNVPF